MKNIITTQQIKAARALLGWDQIRLAEAAGLGIATVRRIEAVEGPALAPSVAKMRAALEAAGVRFLSANSSGGCGVRLR